MGGASAAADFKTELKENYRAWSDANLSGFVKEDMDDRVGGILGLGNLAGGLVDALVRLGLKPEDAVVGVMQFLSAKSKEYQQVIVNSYQRDPNGTLALTLAGPGFATLIAEHEGERIYQGAVQWSQKPTLDRTEEGVEVLGNAALLFAPFLGEARAGAVLGKAGNLAKASELGAEARAAAEISEMGRASAIVKEGVGAVKYEDAALVGKEAAAIARKYPLLEVVEPGEFIPIKMTADGKFRYSSALEPRMTPHTQLDFVLRDGKLTFGKSHSYLAHGERVDYAGKIYFNSDRSQIVSWDNWSGHYRPSATDMIGQQSVRAAFKEQFGYDLPAFQPHDFGGLH